MNIKPPYKTRRGGRKTNRSLKPARTPKVVFGQPLPDNECQVDINALKALVSGQIVSTMNAHNTGNKLPKPLAGSASKRIVGCILGEYYLIKKPSGKAPEKQQLLLGLTDENSTTE